MTEQQKGWKEEITREMAIVQSKISTIEDEQLLLRVRVGKLEETTTRRVDELAYRVVEIKSEMEVQVIGKCKEIEDTYKRKIADSIENTATFLSKSLDEMEAMRRNATEQEVRISNLEKKIRNTSVKPEQHLKCFEVIIPQDSDMELLDH